MPAERRECGSCQPWWTLKNIEFVMHAPTPGTAIPPPIGQRPPRNPRDWDTRTHLGPGFAGHGPYAVDIVFDAYLNKMRCTESLWEDEEILNLPGTMGRVYLTTFEERVPSALSPATVFMGSLGPGSYVFGDGYTAGKPIYGKIEYIPIHMRSDHTQPKVCCNKPPTLVAEFGHDIGDHICCNLKKDIICQCYINAVGGIHVPGECRIQITIPGAIEIWSEQLDSGQMNHIHGLTARKEELAAKIEDKLAEIGRQGVGPSFCTGANPGHGGSFNPPTMEPFSTASWSDTCRCREAQEISQFGFEWTVHKCPELG